MNENTYDENLFVNLTDKQLQILNKIEDLIEEAYELDIRTAEIEETVDCAINQITRSDRQLAGQEKPYSHQDIENKKAP